MRLCWYANGKEPVAGFEKKCPASSWAEDQHMTQMEKKRNLFQNISPNKENIVKY